MTDRIIQIKELDLLETVADDDEIAVQRKADGVVYKAEKSTLRGDKGMNWQGEWVAGTYQIDDVVEHNGSSWIATAVTTQEPSAVASEWDLVAERGDDGVDGDNGDNAYVYIAYASDDQGTDFTLTFNPALDFIAVLSTDTEIPSPQASDFVGLWTQLADNSNYFNSNRTAQTGTSPYESLSGAVNGTNTTFTVPGSFYISGTLKVFLNGKLVIANDGWSETLPSSGTFDFIEPPLTGDVVTAFFQDQELSVETVITTGDRASQAEAEAGTENEKYMTALRTKQAIDENVIPGKNSVELDTNEYQLVGDAAAPGNNKYYGTEETGVKGFHDVPVVPESINESERSVDPADDEGKLVELEADGRMDRAFLRMPSIVTFTASGDYTPTSGARYIHVKITGGGGGGSGAQIDSGGFGQAGADGGSTEFGALLTALGGKGGVRVETPGRNGFDAHDGNVSNNGGMAGTPRTSTSSIRATGVNGNGGEIKESFFDVSGLSTPISITVGQGGDGGVGGADVGDGGDGGNGRVEITEYF